MKKITVLIMGETDWRSQTFDKAEFDTAISKDNEKMISDIAGRMGRLLDGSHIEDMSPERAFELITLLPVYVANTESYQTMLAKGLQTIFITSFRVSGGYKTRIAGTIPQSLESIHSPDGSPRQLGCLYKVMGQNENYNKDTYHPSSIFHRTMGIAKKFSKVEILFTNPQQNPQFN